MMRRRRFALAAALCLAPSLAPAFGAAGAYSSPYLKLPMGARGTGMGEAFSGIADDVNALYYNAAGLSSVEDGQVQVMHLENFGGIRYENIGLALPTGMLGFGSQGTLAFAYTLIGVEDMLRTRIQPGTADAYDQTYADRGLMFTSGASVITLGYAFAAGKRYSVGAAFKALNEKVDTVWGWGYALDLGTLSQIPVVPGLALGVTLQNIGSSPISNAPLPVTLRLGLGHTWKQVFTEAGRGFDVLRSDLDVVTPIAPVDSPYRIGVGAEYRCCSDTYFFALRVGYRAPNDLGALAGLTSGLGLGTKMDAAQLDLDYAFVPYGDLGNSHRVGLNLHFSQAVQKAAEPVAALGALMPPTGLRGIGLDRRVNLSWFEPKTKADGYNVYMTYDPASNKWYRLNKGLLVGTAQGIPGMHNGYPVHLAMTSVRRRADGTVEESVKSLSVRVIPQGAPGSLAPAASPAKKEAKAASAVKAPGKAKSSKAPGKAAAPKKTQDAPAKPSPKPAPTEALPQPPAWP